MKQLVTEGIILSRTDFGEADRILTILTPDQGKLRLLAKGVRRVKSKLAGGIELFSISTITFVKGRGDIGTVVSTRLVKHYSHIVQDLDRTMVGYELIKQLNKITEDEPPAEYFELLRQVFEALDDNSITLPLIRLWFLTQLLRLGGHEPNLQSDVNGQPLQSDLTYDFDFEHMCFMPSTGHGRFGAGFIKYLRLLFAGHSPKTLAQIRGGAALVEDCTQLVRSMTDRYL